MSDAEAFLHERLGDMEAALGLYLADIRASWQALQGALQGGGVQVLQEQGGGQGRGSDTGVGQGVQGSSALGGWLRRNSLRRAVRVRHVHGAAMRPVLLHVQPHPRVREGGALGSLLCPSMAAACQCTRG